MRYQGTVKLWKDDRGYGFVAPRGGGDDVYIHVTALPRNERATVGAVVTFEVGRDARGRLRAKEVRFLDKHGQDRIPQDPVAWRSWVGVGTFAMLAALVVVGLTPALVVPAVLLMSLATFAAYAVDKGAAQRGEWRVSEQVLLTLGLAGGWPGALVAQHLLRHKSRKQSFQEAFWVCVVLNLLAVAAISYAFVSLRRA